MDLLADRNLFNRRFFVIYCPVVYSSINSSFRLLDNLIDIQSFRSILTKQFDQD